MLGHFVTASATALGANVVEVIAGVPDLLDVNRTVHFPVVFVSALAVDRERVMQPPNPLLHCLQLCDTGAEGEQFGRGFLVGGYRKHSSDTKKLGLSYSSLVKRLTFGLRGV
jgi:hypothetical protein